MPTPTQTPDQDELDPAKDVGQANIDDIVNKRFNPDPEKRAAGDPSDPRGEGSDSLRDRETQAAGDPSDPRDIAQKENEGDGTWKTKVAVNPGKSGNAPSALGRRKKGIFGSIAIIVAIIGIIGSLLSGAWGLVNLKETLVQKISQRATSAMERREARILAKKFSKDFTNGCTIKIKCRYRGFTGLEIKKFNKRAAQHGYRLEKIESRTLNPLKNKVRIVKFDINNPDKTIGNPIQPEDFKKAVRNTPELRSAFKNFYKSNVEFYSGKAAKSVWSRTKTYIGKRSTGEGEGATEAERGLARERELTRRATSGQETSLSAEHQALDVSATDTAAQKAEKAKDLTDINSQNDQAKEFVGEKAAQLSADRSDYTKNLSEPKPGTAQYDKMYQGGMEKLKGMGGGVEGVINPNPLFFALGICTARSLLVTANHVRSVAQAIQLVNFSMMFMTLADRIKAGDADGNTSRQINDTTSMLTSKDNSGRTAFDSLGYNWAATGAVRGGKDEDIGKYQNGGPPAGILGGAVKAVADMPIMGSICKLAESKVVTGAFIAISVFGAGKVIASGARGAIKAVVDSEIKKTIKNKIEDKAGNVTIRSTLKAAVDNPVSKTAGMLAFFMYGVPPLISTIARASTHTVVTGDEKGRDVGNAVVAGFGSANSQTSKAQGLRPINISEAMSQDKLAYQQQLNIAKLDGINQFDVTNQYAFANKFALAVIPSMSKFSSIDSIPSGIAGITSYAVSGLSQKASALTNEEAQYQYCKDDNLEKADVAGDPFCNPQYGMDSNVLDGDNYDPEKITEYLYNNQYIEDDGKPTGDFDAFIKECMQTDEPIGDTEDCTKKDEKFTMMRLYCMDTSIDADMNNGSGIGCAPETTDSSNDIVTGSNPASDKVDLATLYQPSGDIACADGSNDLGIQDGYHAGKKLKVRLCAVQGIPETGDLSTVSGANGKLVVNSRMSAIYVKLGQDAKAAGLGDVSAGEGFRTMARQQYFYDCYKSGSCNSGNQAAPPGYSNHQSGVAVDWSASVYNWLSSGHAKDYGIKKCNCSEAWHYSPDGG